MRVGREVNGLFFLLHNCCNHCVISMTSSLGVTSNNDINTTVVIVVITAPFYWSSTCPSLALPAQCWLTHEYYRVPFRRSCSVFVHHGSIRLDEKEVGRLASARAHWVSKIVSFLAFPTLLPSEDSEGGKLTVQSRHQLHAHPNNVETCHWSHRFPHLVYDSSAPLLFCLFFLSCSVNHFNSTR